MARHRRLAWGGVLALVVLSGLSACASSMVGTGAGLSLAAVLTAVLLLGGGATQTGCSACLSLPSPDAHLRPDVGPCLTPLPPDVGPCLSPDVGPCLTPRPPDVGPCLSQVPPDAGPADVGPCLSQLPPDATSDARPGAEGVGPVAPVTRGEALASLRDRLPADVRSRLGLDGEEGQS